MNDTTQTHNLDQENDPTPNFKGVWIPKIVWRHKGISWFERNLWAELDILCDDEKGCWASNEYLCNVFGVELRTLQRGLSNLRKKGLIRYGKTDGRRRFIFTCKIEIFSENPIDKNEEKDTPEVTKMSPHPCQKCHPTNESSPRHTLSSREKSIDISKRYETYRNDARDARDPPDSSRFVSPEVSADPLPAEKDPPPPQAAPREEHDFTIRDAAVFKEHFDSKKVDFTIPEILRWGKAYGENALAETFDLLMAEKKRSQIINPGGWMHEALRSDFCGSRKRREVNEKVLKEAIQEGVKVKCSGGIVKNHDDGDSVSIDTGQDEFQAVMGSWIERAHEKKGSKGIGKQRAKKGGRRT